jgi:hypothetical protein
VAIIVENVVFMSLKKVVNQVIKLRLVRFFCHQGFLLVFKVLVGPNQVVFANFSKLLKVGFLLKLGSILMDFKVV